MNDLVVVHVDSLSHDGRGVAHINGKAVFVHGALPGETIELEIIKKRKRRDEAHLKNVITTSEHRVEPFCRHFSICGGCAIQHIDAAEQIRYKQEIHTNNLKKIAGIDDLDLLSPLQGPSFNYRRRARLGVKYVIKKQRVLVGFREKTHHFLADIDSCPVLVDGFANKIVAFQELVESLECYNKIPQIELSASDEVNVIILRHLVDLCDKDLNLLERFSIKENIHIYSQPKGLDSIRPLFPSIAQELYYRLPDYDIKIYFQPWDFIQVNAEMNKLMIAKALDLLQLTQTDRVLDLFCGIGNFSLPMAKHAEFVMAIEGEESLVNRGRENASRNNITNIEFKQADLRQPLDSLSELKINKILLDPPRSGAAECLPQIVQLQPELIVYVSCNSATFARDAQILSENGYALKSTGVMDMFPQTAHVECISQFEKKNT